MFAPDRRSLITLAASLLVAGPAAAQPLAIPAQFSRIVVDVDELRAKGAGPQADILAAALLQEGRRVFADRIGGAGPTLVVRLTALSMRSYAGGQGAHRGQLGGGGDSDYLEGEALVVGPNRAIVARFPQLSAVPSSSGGAWYEPASELRRLQAIAQHYAWWLRRTMGV
jgi:hypothetical protein